MPIPYYKEVELCKRSFSVRKRACGYTVTPTKFQVFIKPNPNYIEPKESIVGLMREEGMHDEEIIKELKKIIILPHETDPIDDINRSYPYEKRSTIIVDTAPPKTILDFSNTYTGKVSSYILPNGELYQQIGDHCQADILNDLSYCEDIIYGRTACIGPNKSPIDRIKNNMLKAESYLRHINENELNQYDVRSYINWTPLYNSLSYYKNADDKHPHDYLGEGDYSDELKQLIISLTKAKIYIYNYYYQLCSSVANLEKLKRELKKLNNKYDFDHDVTKLICMIGIDKVEKTRVGRYTPLESMVSYNEKNPNYLIIRNLIRSARTNIYESYFNYFLRGYEVIRLPKVVLNKKGFEIIPIKETIEVGSEREYKKELDEIMTKVKPEHRYLYSLK